MSLPAPVNVTVAARPAAAPGAPALEMAERKGLGHPDTICDALAEELSRALCRRYVERFGRVLHHNVDKALLVGGAARAWLGGGEVTEPIEIILAGRATSRVGGEVVPVEELAVESARAWLGANLRGLDPERHVRVRSLVRAGSADLAELFGRGASVALANDTSFGVGFAPLSPLEQLVLDVERSLNAPSFRDAHPEGGEDVKVMGVRADGATELTIARAFIGPRLPDAGAYLAAKERVRDHAVTLAASRGIAATAVVNAADDPARGSVYVTVTGLSAESGDDGQVGRGNRVNGLITPLRPMSLEAAAGKNPVSHVGKLYNVAAGRIARRLVAEVAGIASAECVLVSRIGAPVTEPRVAALTLSLAPGAGLADVEAPARDVARDEIGGLSCEWERIVSGEDLF